MTAETKKKDNATLYLVTTVAFIITGIILTGIINKNRVSTDIRSRASATSGIAATAVVNEINYDNNTVVVDQLLFASSPEKNMGSWIITPPTATKLDALVTGMKVKITIDPMTLDIGKHMLTAKEIKKK